MASIWSPIFGLLLVFLPLAVSSSSLVFPLSGNVYPIGHFYVTMYIGEPPKPYFLDIDTGGNITWLECIYAGKHSCNKVPHPLYKPNKNNLRVPCGHRLCNSLRQDLGGHNPQCPTSDPHHCHYHARYIDGTTDGVLVLDKISHHGSNGDKTFAFGCGYKQYPCGEKPVDGVLGLGRGEVGLIAQLKMAGMITKDVIGHCISIKGGGYLFLGDGPVPSTGVTWVPMSRTGNHYSPGRAKLLFDGQQIIADGMEVIFDSGATYTYVRAQAYHELVSKLKATLSNSLKEVRDPALPQCWKGREPFRSVDDVKKEFKPLALTVNQNIFEIPPENYLVITNLGNVCLGILDGSKDGLRELSLIGDITMQNMIVMYDNERGLLGWARAQCDRVPESESAITSHL